MELPPKLKELVEDEVARRMPEIVEHAVKQVVTMQQHAMIVATQSVQLAKSIINGAIVDTITKGR